MKQHCGIDVDWILVGILILQLWLCQKLNIIHKALYNTAGVIDYLNVKK